MNGYDIYFDEKKHRCVFDYNGIDTTGLDYLCTASLQDIEEEIRRRCYEGQRSLKFDEFDIERLYEIKDVFQKSRVLLDAVAKGNEIETDKLLKIGADPNFQATDGKSALMIAARYGYESRLGVVKLLVQAGACLDSRDQYGLTALDYANEAQADESWRPYISDFLKEHMKLEIIPAQAKQSSLNQKIQFASNSAVTQFPSHVKAKEPEPEI